MTDADIDANPHGCQSRHPTATDVVMRTVRRGASQSLWPVVGPDGKNVIDRYPLRCWHGKGHEGKHGYGAVTW